jgi:hypothetical protein
MITLRKLSIASLSFIALPLMLHAQGGGPGGRGGAPPKNLQVLPKDFTRQQVIVRRRSIRPLTRRRPRGSLAKC